MTKGVEMTATRFQTVLLLATILGVQAGLASADTSPGDRLTSTSDWFCGYRPSLPGAPVPRGPGDPQPGTAWTDVTHTVIDIEVDPTARTVAGTVTITATSQVNGLSQFVAYLDPTGGAMTVSSVGLNGTGFSVTNDEVTVTLDAVYDAGQAFTVSIDYGGSPTKGIYWGDHDNGTAIVDIVATLSEPYSARGWWVGKDVLNDKSTFDLWVTVDDVYTVASNGILQGVDILAGNRLRYRWAEINPMIPYLASLAIADYDLYSTTYSHLGDSCPMEFYILPEANTAANRSRADTYVVMTEVFSDLYGQYPFVNEKGGMAHTPTLGGTFMEHQTIPSMPRFDIEWINAHELAHQWFGDNITCETWGDIWLNEGFASFSEAIWREFRPGGSFAAYKTRMAQRYPGNSDAQVYVTNVNSVGSIFSGNSTYRKGAWVVHMLRGVLGDPLFFQALSDYRAAYEGDSATTAEFAASISATAGYDLTFFTDQWVMNPGSPDYVFSWTHAVGAGQDYLLVEIVQDQLSRGYGVIRMPIRIGVTTVSGSSTKLVWNVNDTDSFAIPIDGAPVSVSFDPDEWILTHSETTVPWAGIVPICQGDMNEDGVRRGDDIALFIGAMLDASASATVWRRADMDFDGVRDAVDLAMFVSALLDPGACPPSP